MKWYKRHKEKIRFVINILFALYNFVIGIFWNSLWFLTVSAYYIVLGVMRSCIIKFASIDSKSHKFVMKFSGIMIFVLSLVLCFIVYMTVDSNGAKAYHEIVMITIALYAFTKITLAIMSAVKKTKTVYDKTLNNITLADSIVAVYSLQRSMLVPFAGMSAPDILLMNAVSGVEMCIIIIFIGINLITGGNVMAKSKITDGIEKISEGITKGYKK